MSAEPGAAAPQLLVPDWPAPANVRSLLSTRGGGVSRGPFASFNLGDHVGDDPAAVAANRAALNRHLPAPPLWLRQTHSTTCVAAHNAAPGVEVDADAAWSDRANVVCAVLTADCLPILLCDVDGERVAAVHAGWRGLAAGVIEAATRALGAPQRRLLAWLGPAIGAAAFEVGDEVRRVFVAHSAAAAAAFTPHGDGKWLCSLTLLAQQRLNAVNVALVYGAAACTFSDSELYYSYRRDGVSGRFASLIWRTD